MDDLPGYAQYVLAIADRNRVILLCAYLSLSVFVLAYLLNKAGVKNVRAIVYTITILYYTSLAGFAALYFGWYLSGRGSQ
jgi:hypothetical protein